MVRKVEITNVDTSKLPRITNQEKEELLLKIKAGDNEAREEFIKGNLRLVLSIVQRFAYRAENMDDIFQIGCVGLIKSIDNFDLSLNVQFSTYAVPMIIGEIKRYLRDNNPIRVSRSTRDLAYAGLAMKEELTKELNREPTIDEIAKKMGIEAEELVIGLEAIQDPISLQEPVSNDGTENIYILDQIKDTRNSDDKWAEEMTIRDAVKKLNKREKMVISQRFFEGRTQTELAEELGISQAQISRIEKDAMGKLKKIYK